MLNYSSYKYDTLSGKYGRPVFNVTKPQNLIPFNNLSKTGWCDIHKRWEPVLLCQNSKMYFSCGTELKSNIGISNSWNKNQLELIAMPEKFFVQIRERYSWTEVHDQQIYEFYTIFSKTIDILSGNMLDPDTNALKVIPEEVKPAIEKYLLDFCNVLYGAKIKAENVNLDDFIKFPSCPNFNRIVNRIDGLNTAVFRKFTELFKTFCFLMQIKESKQLRKDFSADPNLIFLHAMAEFIGITDANAKRLFVQDKNLYKMFAGNNGVLRFSIKNRCLYTNNSNILLPGLRMWFHNAAMDKSQTVAVKRLIKFMSEGNMFILKDSVETYFNNINLLPAAFHRRILKEGFTRVIHDLLMLCVGNDEENLRGFESDEAKVSNLKINYDKSIFRFEDIISLSSSLINLEKQAKLQELQKTIGSSFKDSDENTEIELPENKYPCCRDFKIGENLISKGKYDDFYFCIPRDTDQMYEISEKMKNCVGFFYKNRVINGECLIVTMIHKNKFKACFEIVMNRKTGHYEIIQAYGYANSPIKMQYKDIILQWMKNKGLTGKIKFRY